MNTDTDKTIVEQAVSEGASYDVIHKRLLAHGNALEECVTALNRERAEQVGSTDMQVVGRVRVRTENNCVGRDIVQVGDLLVFGYNVFIGLKKNTRVEDVFSVYQLKQEGESYGMEAVSIQDCFLADTRFRDDFEELYRYYKETRLIQLMKKGGKLLAGFQIGERLDDVRVFRWTLDLDPDTQQPLLSYIDNRGERDLDLPEPQDFVWNESQREDIVNGRFAHININNQLFVETTGGTLTVKIENNTETGKGVFEEPVDEKNQSLNDAQIAWAQVGTLTLLKVLPYKESDYRYLLFNPLTETVLRIDAIGDSCVQLPEDHGIIFPDGYYLSSGDYKTYATGIKNLRFKRHIRSPNGEDVLYVFYEPHQGLFALLPYNMITRTLQNPIITHGYALSEDGTVVVFTADDEPTRIHPMQLWHSPYFSDEFASAQPVGQTFFSRIGNAELVRGISDLYSVGRLIKSPQVSAAHFETLIATSRRLFDDYFWISDPETGTLAAIITQINDTVELIIDEYEKVEAIRRDSHTAMNAATETQNDIIRDCESGNFENLDAHVSLLDRLRHQRGHVATLTGYRYIDTDALQAMDEHLLTLNETMGERTARYLTSDGAFDSYKSAIDAVDEAMDSHTTVAAMQPDLDELDRISSALDLLSELVTTLKIDDPTIQTTIIERISDVYSNLNRSRANARQKRESMGSAEAIEQFAAQFKLFSQSVTNALGQASTPESADDQLTRLMVQLEEIEGQFGEHEKFLVDIIEKREEVHDTFTAHKQQLLDARQARALTLSDAVGRMLSSIERRVQRLPDNDALNTYLASDTLVLKTRDMVANLRELGSAVKADEVESRLKMIKDLALSTLRDRSDLYSDGGKVIKLGSHAFSVNTEELDLSILPRGDSLALHLAGTHYFEPIDHPELNILKPYWSLQLDSETETVYRAEYLAYQIIEETQTGRGELDWSSLVACEADVLSEVVRKFAASRYREGYEKGVHDADATRILEHLLPALDAAELLRFNPRVRALAQFAWCALLQADAVEADAIQSGEVQAHTIKAYTVDATPRSAMAAQFQARAQSALALRTHYNSHEPMQQLVRELTQWLIVFLNSAPWNHRDPQTGSTATDSAAIVPDSKDNELARVVAEYLAEEIGRNELAFCLSRQALSLMDAFKVIQHKPIAEQFQDALQSLTGRPDKQWSATCDCMQAVLGSSHQSIHYLPEAAARLLLQDSLPVRELDVDVTVSISGLLGQHKTITDARLQLSIDEFLTRLAYHAQVVVPAFHQYHALRQRIAQQAREELRLDEFRARPLSSFVRNQLINDVYLPMIGDNLAKQIGTMGENKRSDLNGLLMMISPPGYGKTTLMEYVASRLGLTFMKINGPALGHDTVSLDPQSAPDATSRQELHKLNLALEMGDNVMLYIDDIQHTHAEFLQKFISLCDSTRRIEGVWKNQTRTYDLRGRKFCVVMAGNPYTESGESFRVPDMLANRADIYNLGDILSGTEQQFAMSYIENALSSNPTLAPLATRDMNDVYKLVGMAQGREVPSTDLSHAYGGAEISEITRVLQHMLLIRDTILKVNQQYILSAAQEDRYRTEPRFGLQGSYRNMNKLAEKVSAVMNEAEREELIEDHYRAEAQLLTQGSEANLLKLHELRGTLQPEQTARWHAIGENYRRNQSMGGDDADAAQRIASQIAELADVMKVQQTEVSITNTPSPEFTAVLDTLHDTIENTLFPLVRSMDQRIAQDIDAHSQLKRLVNEVEAIKRSLQ